MTSLAHVVREIVKDERQETVLILLMGQFRDYGIVVPRMLNTKWSWPYGRAPECLG
jgi:hypothetical protein